MSEMSDEQFKLAKFLLDFQQIKEKDGLLMLEPRARRDGQRYQQTFGRAFDDLYAEMDEAFWDLASHYDDGWDIIREAGARG